MPDVARFTALLFADQSLDGLLISKKNGELQLADDPWTRLAEAAECLRRGG